VLPPQTNRLIRQLAGRGYGGFATNRNNSAITSITDGKLRQCSRAVFAPMALKNLIWIDSLTLIAGKTRDK
jgi:hypothetical protein